VPLAAFWISQKRSREALELAEEFANRSGVSPITTAQLMTGAVRSRADSESAKRVNAWLETELRKPHVAWEQLALLGAKAQLLEAMGQSDESKYDEAIATYEEVLRRAKTASPGDARSAGVEYMINNLCMLLVLRRPGDADRAIALMNDLIAIRGPMPAFLDTRAVAYLVKGGKTEEAANDLELALIQFRRPGYLFHLGWAYTNTPDKRGRAQKQLDDAKSMGLTLADLHPLEARKFNELYLVK
jgi:tetratricopeptide (TPR) repeat protein